MHLPVTIGTDGNGIFDDVGTTVRERLNVVSFQKCALSENLTKRSYYAALQILRKARSSRLLTASRLAFSSR